MPSYVVLGHGLEDFGADRAVVPPGCMLVLSERAGESGIIHWPLYEALSNPDNRRLFRNPVRHKKALETLVNRHLRIYKEGQPYPALIYDITFDRDRAVEPTGIFPIPTPHFVRHPEKEGPERYQTSYNGMEKALAGSIMKPHKAVPQAILFEKKPGIYYSFLCRTLKTEEDAVKALLASAFPGRDVSEFYSDTAFDFFEGAQEWVSQQKDLTESQVPVMAEIRAIVDAVMHHRRASSARQSERRGAADPLTQLMHLLGMRRPGHDRLAAAIAAIPDVNAVYYKTQYTPLGAAAAQGHRAAVAALLGRGAAVNGRDLWGATALYRAADDEQEGVCRDLLAAGADLRIPLLSGDTVLHVVAESEDMIGLLGDILKMGLTPTVTTQEGDTPLHSAAFQGNAAAIPILLAAGADPNAQNKGGLTPLMVGILEQKREVVTVLAAITDPLLRTREGQSALDLAIAERQDEIAVEVARYQKPAGGWGPVAAITLPGLSGLRAFAARASSSEKRRRTRKKTSSA